MSKRDELLRAGGANVLESMGVGPSRQVGLPAGMEGMGAMKKPPHLEGTNREKGALRIATGRIIADEDQPRTEFDPEELGRLAESMRTRGQLQPIRVRWDAVRETYVLIAGERRWRAAQMAGLAELSCVVHEGTPDPGELLALQLVENALRSDLTPIEQARAYKRLIAVNGWSARQLAAELAVAPSTVTRALSLLDLPEIVQDQVEQGGLAAASAYEVSKVDGHDLQAEVARAVVEGGLRGSEVTELVQAIRAKRPVPRSRPEPVTIDLGDATVRVTWRKEGPDLIKLLKLALKHAQMSRDDQAA
jgi:ParB family chromosome partitioning protein